MRKVKMVGSVLLYIVVYFLIFTGVSKLWYGPLLNNEVIGSWINDNGIGIIILNDIIAIPAFMLLVYLLKKKSIFVVTKFKKISLSQLLICSLIGICMGVFLTNFFKLSFIQEIPIFEEIMVYLYDTNILMFLGFVFIGTCFKEILFRGLIFNDLQKEMYLVVAILIHAVLYGALFFYFNIPLTLFSILGNIVVVLTYIYTGSIWGAFTAQAFNNFTAYFIRNTNPEMFGSMQILAIAVTVIIMAISLYFLNKLKSSNKDNLSIGEAA